MILKERHRLSLWPKLWSPFLCFKAIAVIVFTLLIGFVGSSLHTNGKLPGMNNFKKGVRWLENRWMYGGVKTFRFPPQDVVMGVDPTSFAYFGFKRISEKDDINILPGHDLHIDQNTDLEQTAKLFALLDVLDLWPKVIPDLGWGMEKKERLEVGSIAVENFDGSDFFSRLSQTFGPYYEDRFLFTFVNHLNNNFVKKLFTNKEFMRIYIESLDRYSRIDYLQAIFEPKNEELRGFLAYKVELDPFINIDEELLKLYMFSEHLRRRYLYPVTHLYPFLNEFSNIIRLKILVRHPLPVEILYLEFNGKRLDLIEGPTILNGKPYQKNMEPKMVMFHGFKSLQEPTGNPNLILHYRLPGIDFEFMKKVRSFAFKVGKKSDFVLSRLSPVDLSNFSGIHVEENKKLITLRGTVRIDQNLQIPKGYIVRAGPGVRIELTDFASFISYSPIEFMGSPNSPIVISAGNGGQGFAVLDAEKKSILENIVFENLSEPRIGSWSLTGAVTFYESSVEMRNVKFINSKAEDGLNIVRGDFLLVECIFENSQSDALDVDFGNGKIFRTQFLGAGNDAVDISGGQVQIRDLFVSKAEDKGISLGEKSKVSGGKIIIRDAVVGIASKDLSRGDFDEVKIEKTKIGLAVYQKKAIFGPGYLHVKNFTSTELKKNWLIEEESTLKIDGGEIIGKERQLAKLLY